MVSITMIFTKIISKIKLFINLPLSRKVQYIQNSYYRIKTNVVYKNIFQKLGRKTVIRSPLLLTPEYISVGNGVFIWDDARVEGIHQHDKQSFNPLITIEDGVTIQQRCHITAATHLEIGTNTLISFDVMIQDTDHEYQGIGIPIGQQPLSVMQTKIGSNCFIGSGAKIQAGTVLGEHCVVGANSVVRGVYPSHCVIVGVPARVIKRYDMSKSEWVKTDNKGNYLQ